MSAERLSNTLHRCHARCRCWSPMRSWRFGRRLSTRCSLRSSSWRARPLGRRWVRRLETLQPFHLTRDPQRHPLARLVLHTNHAKHRTPAVTAVRLITMNREDQMPRSLRDVSQRPEEPLRVGHVIAETPMGQRMLTTLLPSIGVNRPGTNRWPVLMTEIAEERLQRLEPPHPPSPQGARPP